MFGREIRYANRIEKAIRKQHGLDKSWKRQCGMRYEFDDVTADAFFIHYGMRETRYFKVTLKREGECIIRETKDVIGDGELSSARYLS